MSVEDCEVFALLAAYERGRADERAWCVAKIKHWFGGDDPFDEGYECIREINELPPTPKGATKCDRCGNRLLKSADGLRLLCVVCWEEWPNEWPQGACYCDHDPLTCRLLGHHATPELFAEWEEGGQFDHARWFKAMNNHEGLTLDVLEGCNARGIG